METVIWCLCQDENRYFTRNIFFLFAFCFLFMNMSNLQNSGPKILSRHILRTFIIRKEVWTMCFKFCQSLGGHYTLIIFCLSLSLSLKDFHEAYHSSKYVLFISVLYILPKDHIKTLLCYKVHHIIDTMGENKHANFSWKTVGTIS